MGGGKTVRWGILGASKFASKHMGPAIHAARNAQLAALATSDPAKAAPFEEFAPEIEVMGDYDALLARDDIDAVYVPLPNHLHVEWTKRALAAGKGVLTEKPIAMRADEFDDLIAARDTAGRLAAEAYMIVHHPQWQRARALIEGGAIGPLRHVEGVFTYDNRADMGNIRNRPETGGGALRDIGVYPLGATRFATGLEPDAVTAWIDWENDVDATSHVRAEFPGFSMNALVSMRMAKRQEMTFHGETGRLRLTAPFNPADFGEAVVELATEADTRIETFPLARQYVLQVEAFGAALGDPGAYACPLEFSRGTQAMIDAALAAGRA